MRPSPTRQTWINEKGCHLLPTTDAFVWCLTFKRRKLTVLMKTCRVDVYRLSITEKAIVLSRLSSYFFIVTVLVFPFLSGIINTSKSLSYWWIRNCCILLLLHLKLIWWGLSNKSSALPTTVFLLLGRAPAWFLNLNLSCAIRRKIYAWSHETF